MKKILPLLLLLLLLIPQLTFAESFSVRINNGNDDVEETVSNGDMYTDSTDLELIHGDGHDQIVGLRFNNVTIPPGSTITKASIKFWCDETGSNDCNLEIAGERNANPAQFTGSDYAVSSRTKTNARSSWSPDAWNQKHNSHQTSSIITIVQEIINLGGWSSGNSMAFIISGSGRRTAESYEGSSRNWRTGERTQAAKLVIEYETTPSAVLPVIEVEPTLAVGSDTIEGMNAPSRTFTITNTGGSPLNFNITEDASWLDCTPTTGTLAVGDPVTITVTYSTTALNVGNYDTSILIEDTDNDNDGRAVPVDYNATLRVAPVLTGSACGDVPVYTENLVNPAILLLLDVSGSMRSQAPLIAAADNNAHTPNLSSIVQQIVNREGWVSGNAMSFIFSNDDGRRVAVSRYASSDLAPLLHVEYSSGSGTGVIDTRVEDDSDDAEETDSGNVNLGSSDLDFDDDNIENHNKWIGIRFVNLDIPQGATITNAYIELVVDESDSSTANITVYGESIDASPTFDDNNHDISSRTRTGGVQWNNIESWESTPTDTRINVAKDVLSDLVKDRSIAWGFGTWSAANDDYHEYTRIHVGTNYNDDEQQQLLQDAIAAATVGGGTPLTPSLRAGKDYFAGETEDEANNEVYFDPGCQPKIVIEITDGMGNTGTTLTNVGTTTKSLTDANISVVGVGFGLDNAEQLNLLAKISNEEGEVTDEDDIYPLHEENSAGVGIPFLANSKDELVAALHGIITSLKGNIFYGSAPTASTRSDKSGNTIIVAKFNPNNWSGDLEAQKYDDKSVLWNASEKMPDVINAFTLDNSDQVILYSNSLLYPFYECKPLGDIIHSTPLVVAAPGYHYSFDDYYMFFNLKKGRDKLVYVGANDGALHAFNLETGVEAWRFYPKSLQADLNVNLVNTNEDLCFTTRNPAGEYCHKYLVDGSPIAGDVYDGTDWSTILITGLGKGGAAYFALDITGGGGTFGNGPDDIKYLWEFTDSDLGFATSKPAIGRVENESTSKWGVFFGSGYSETSQQSTKEAYLYGLNAKDMSPLWGSDTNKIKMVSGTLADDALSSPLLVNIDDDYNEDFVYVGNLYGTMFRVANIVAGQTPIVSKLFDLGRSGHENPITATPTYAYDETDENIWLYFGTGRYEETSDKVSMNQQYFVGLKDNSTLAAAAVDSGNATYFWNAVADSVGDPSQPFKELTVRTATVEGETYRIADSCDSTESAWILKLLNSEAGMIGSERITSKPIVVDGIVYFTTFIPDLDVCAGNGEAWIYALDYKTGCATNAFDINGDGSFDDNDTITIDGVEHKIIGQFLGEGEASDLVLVEEDGDSHILATTNVEGVKDQDIQDSGGNVGVKSWREL